MGGSHVRAHPPPSRRRAGGLGGLDVRLSRGRVADRGQACRCLFVTEAVRAGMGSQNVRFSARS